jgi:HK97 family phage prohead protease
MARSGQNTTESMSASDVLAAERKAKAERQHVDAGVKSVTVKFKTDGLAEGEFVGYASVFGNKDSYGDVVQKGAFANTLAEWERKGVPIPLLWGHNTADPDFNLGELVTAEEDDHGLKVHGRLDMESPKSAQTYRLLKSGRVNQMSFAYSIVDGAYVEPISDDGTTSWRDAYYELRELDLYEVSIVPIGANQETEILAVKSVIGSLAAKAGRTLSAKNEDAIRGALAQAEDIVTSLKSVLPDDSSADEEDQEETSGKEPSSVDAKSSTDVTTPSPSVYLALLELN